MYNKFADDQLINRLKTKKLWLKDEIHRIEYEANISKTAHMKRLATL